jgi:hypothetical protein
LLEFGISFIEFVLATFVPLYAGMLLLLVVSNVSRVQSRYLSAYALGLLFWFFFDTLNDAVQLDVNLGYSLDFNHAALVILFVAGFLSFTLTGSRLLSKENLSSKANLTTFLLAIVVAFGMGIHGIGEGISFGGLAAETQASSILDAIGGIGGGAAYVLHKLLESTIVAVVYVTLARAKRLPFRNQIQEISIVGFAFGIMSAAGEAVGYFVPINSSWFYALGAGAALFVVLQAVRPIFADSEKHITFLEYSGISIAMIIGFLLLYAAALLHS